MKNVTHLYNRLSQQYTWTIIGKGSGKISLLKEALQLQKAIAYLIRNRIVTRLKAGLLTLQNISNRIYLQRHEIRPGLNPLNPLPCRK